MYQSHNTGDCGFFTNRDRKSIYTSLQAMNIEEEDDVEEEEAAWNTEDKVETENDDRGVLGLTDRRLCRYEWRDQITVLYTISTETINFT